MGLFCFSRKNGGRVTLNGNLLLFASKELAAKWKRSRSMKPWLRDKVHVERLDVESLDGLRRAVLVVGCKDDAWIYCGIMVGCTDGHTAQRVAQEIGYSSPEDWFRGDSEAGKPSP